MSEIIVSLSKWRGDHADILEKARIMEDTIKIVDSKNNVVAIVHTQKELLMSKEEAIARLSEIKEEFDALFDEVDRLTRGHGISFMDLNLPAGHDNLYCFGNTKDAETAGWYRTNEETLGWQSSSTKCD